MLSDRPKYKIVELLIYYPIDVYISDMKSTVYISDMFIYVDKIDTLSHWCLYHIPWIPVNGSFLILVIGKHAVVALDRYKMV
jgi:hypothetical protein